MDYSLARSCTVLLASSLTACGLDAPVLSPIFMIATQNAGTSEWLDTLVPAPERELCRSYYRNDLCTLAAEDALRRAISEASPDTLMLQEVWPQEDCVENDPPAGAGAAPFVCSAGRGHQLTRALPSRYWYACGDPHPDSCVAFDPDVFRPTGWQRECSDGDCSALLSSLSSSCDAAGRIALLHGRSGDGPVVLATVHLTAGFGSSSVECRLEQLAALRRELESIPEDVMVLVGGDFNFETTGDGPEAVTLTELLDRHGLRRLTSSGARHRLLDSDLDAVLVRHWSHGAEVTCAAAFVDAELAVPMFDHPLIRCAATTE